MKYFAFYLPQYHPIPENDAWWGKGFTEWTNVVKAKPRFRGHQQPHIPSDLGFYDLRLNEIRQAQARLARRFGLDGFIYYRYWFMGKQLLESPAERLLADKSVDFPFAFCWANESWTRAWDGMDRQVLVEQQYSTDDHLRHFESLVPFFQDDRYIKIEGRPLFIIYRPFKIPDLHAFVKSMQVFFAARNIPQPYLLGVRDSSMSLAAAAKERGLLDGIVDFQPNSLDFPLLRAGNAWIFEGLKKFLPAAVYQRLKLSGSAVKKVNYESLVEVKTQHYASGPLPIVPTVFPSWDNTSRRRTPTVIQNTDANHFRNWLKSASSFASQHAAHPMVFVNAWNEWAEGCHLEPDAHNGLKFLEALQDCKAALTDAPRSGASLRSIARQGA